MKTVFAHFKKYLIRGFLTLIPLILTYLILRLLYFSIDREVAVYLNRLIHYDLPGIGIFMTVVVLYLSGVFASYFIGRKVFNIVEDISQKIPIIKTTYKIGKQISSAFIMPEKQIFKRVVFVEFFKPGSWVVGFVTGEITDGRNTDEKLLKIYIPTPPIPTSGFILLVKEQDIIDPAWKLDDAMKMIISGGIISPETFG